MSPPRLIDAFIDRLIELAAGAEPWFKECGPGNDIANTVSDEACSYMLQICRKKLNRCACCGRKLQLAGYCSPEFLYCRVEPDSHWYDPRNKWSGPRGKRRRKLCFDVAVQAMASVKGDYRGRYS
jgi:hypothetical protein